ncbi:MAG: hypothetical protein EP343_33555 [Deltaproteobacteria bacterium]|nr:MAG: hypothetical protein EP343_33555 [Deltaproteobacteria bacterium]
MTKQQPNKPQDAKPSSGSRRGWMAFCMVTSLAIMIGFIQPGLLTGRSTGGNQAMGCGGLPPMSEAPTKQVKLATKSFALENRDWVSVKNEFCAIKTFYQNNTALSTSISAVTGAVDAYGITLRLIVEYENNRHKWEQATTTLDGVLERIKFAFKGPLTSFGRIYPPFLDNTKDMLKKGKVSENITNQYNDIYKPLNLMVTPLNVTNAALMAAGFSLCDKIVLFNNDVRRKAALKILNENASKLNAVFKRLNNLDTLLQSNMGTINVMKKLSSLTGPLQTATKSLDGLGGVFGIISPLTNSLERELDRRHCVGLKLGGIKIRKCLRFKNQIDKLNSLGKFSKPFEDLLDRYIMKPIVQPITKELSKTFSFGIAKELEQFQSLDTQVNVLKTGINTDLLKADLDFLKNLKSKLDLAYQLGGGSTTPPEFGNNPPGETPVQ